MKEAEWSCFYHTDRSGAGVRILITVYQFAAACRFSKAADDLQQMYKRRHISTASDQGPLLFINATQQDKLTHILPLISQLCTPYTPRPGLSARWLSPWRDVPGIGICFDYAPASSSGAEHVKDYVPYPVIPQSRHQAIAQNMNGFQT
jgi:hypothetical protein